MRKTAAILLSLILCYNIAGYYYVFKTRQLQVKSEIKQLLKRNLPADQLVVIRISSANSHEFTWIHSQEFRFQGCMYDVVRKVMGPSGVTDLYCINDTQEALLFKNLNEWVKEAMNHGKTGSGIVKLLAGFLSGLYPPPDNFLSLIPEIHTICFPEITNCWFDISTNILSPPPRS